MVIVRGRLEPEVGALLLQALAAAREKLYPAGGPSAETSPTDPFLRPLEAPVERPSLGQQQADALALLTEAAMQGGLVPGAAGEQYQVVVHVDAAVLAEAAATGQSALEEGGRVSAETSRALERRDRGCRFPGCHLPFGQGHHIRHWAHGGPTTLSNLAMLCRAHHRAVHEERFQVERGADGGLRFRRPNGSVLADVPPPSGLPDDPFGTLREIHAERGLRLDARTTIPGWLGEHLAVGYAIDVLHPAAQPRAADPMKPAG